MGMEEKDFCEHLSSTGEEEKEEKEVHPASMAKTFFIQTM